ncbi:MAG: hypothetical protein MUF78_10135 [Candidatus Edwardsbacteria bacterium]|jgi:hypothetical protein|nr:hypothetical protein [Candidatus Edwardsbacteria bacterium]
MHPLSIPCIALAAFNAAVGAYYLYLWRRRPAAGEYVSFGLLCCCVALYDGFTAGLYSAETLAEGLFWQRLQLDGMLAVSALLCWFIGIFTDRQGDRVLRAAIVWCTVLLLAALAAGPGLTLSPADPIVAQVDVPFLPTITYYEAAMGPIYQLGSLTAVLLFPYLLWCVYDRWRRTRDRLLLPALAGLAVYFGGVVSDLLVSLRVYEFVYVSEYAFLGITVAMTYALLERYVAAQTAFEQLNASLERQVRDRTAEIAATLARVKKLEGIVPICMSCKRIRDDRSSWHLLETYISEHTDAMFSHGVCPECKEKFIREFEKKKHQRPGS